MSGRPWITLLLVLLPLVGGAAPPFDATVRTLYWEDLRPAGWVPAEIDYSMFFSEPETWSESDDQLEDPKSLQEIDAPVMSALHGVKARIPGYLVPVSMNVTRVREVLLVPYFGACIHLPPPPSNQVVLVELPSPMSLDDLWEMGPVWMTGVLHVSSRSTDMAHAGYAMRAELVEIYQPEE